MPVNVRSFRTINLPTFLYVEQSPPPVNTIGRQASAFRPTAIAPTAPTPLF
jgi:hypothetical protein